jgi:hypothetical protein
VRNPQILDAADLLGLAGDGFQAIQGGLAGFYGRQRFDGGPALRLDCFQQRADFWIKPIPEHLG